MADNVYDEELRRWVKSLVEFVNGPTRPAESSRWSKTS